MEVHVTINEVEAIRDSQRWSNEELALALGVKIHTVWHWLAGRRRVNNGEKRLLELVRDFPDLGPTLLRIGRRIASRADMSARDK